MTKKLLLLVLLLVCLAFPMSAQDTEPTPLMEMLALVPIEGSGELYYADIPAALATRGVDPITSHDAWENASDEHTRQWLAALPRTMLPDFQSTFFHYLSDGIDASIIDLLAIERSMAFGQPPSRGQIVQGTFDADTIIEGFTTQFDFDTFDYNDLTLLCSPDGCDMGLEIDLSDRNPALIFGGQFGRREPLALSDDLILSSPDILVLNTMLEAYRWTDRSLANDPDYMSVATALADTGTLRQAFFFADTIYDGDALTDLFPYGSLTEEQIEDMRERLGLDDPAAANNLLPPYSLVTFAETVQDDMQVARVFLVYPNNAAAYLAATRIENLLQPDGIMSLVQRRSVYELFMERDVTSIDIEILEQEERSLVMVSFPAPLVTVDTPEVRGGMLRQSGLQFHLLLNMFISRDMLWLATN